MNASKSPVRTLLLVAWAAALGGCGLVEQDVTTLNYKLMPIRYTLDTRQLAIPDNFWRLRCGEGRPDCCDMRVNDCNVVPLTCREDACVTAFRYEAYSTIDLRAQAPALTRSGAQRYTNLYVNRMRYDVENGINIDLPEIDLYLGPLEANRADHPMAEKFATIPATSSKSSASGRDIQVLPTSRELFARYARQSQSFNLIIAAPVNVASSGPPLTGRATMEVVIELAGALDL
jgi:hypothetical protein